MSPPLLQSHVRQRSPDVHVVPGASMMFLVAGSFLGGVVTGSLSFFRLLYGTKRRTGPVCPEQRGDGETDEINTTSNNSCFKLEKNEMKNKSLKCICYTKL